MTADCHIFCCQIKWRIASFTLKGIGLVFLLKRQIFKANWVNDLAWKWFYRRILLLLLYWGRYVMKSQKTFKAFSLSMILKPNPTFLTSMCPLCFLPLTEFSQNVPLYFAHRLMLQRIQTLNPNKINWLYLMVRLKLEAMCFIVNKKLSHRFFFWDSLVLIL